MSKITSWCKTLVDRYPSIRYVLSSVSSWVVDNALYYAFLFPFGAIATLGEVGASTAAQVLARILSSFYNFNVNKFFVFREKGNYKASLLKYYLLCIPQTAISVLVLDVLIGNLDLSNNLLKLTLKIIVEAILFVLSYFIQNKWVFTKHSENESK